MGKTKALVPPTLHRAFSELETCQNLSKQRMDGKQYQMPSGCRPDLSCRMITWGNRGPRNHPTYCWCPASCYASQDNPKWNCKQAALGMAKNLVEAHRAFWKALRKHPDCLGQELPQPLPPSQHTWARCYLQLQPCQEHSAEKQQQEQASISIL